MERERESFLTPSYKTIRQKHSLHVCTFQATWQSYQMLGAKTLSMFHILREKRWESMQLKRTSGSQRTFDYPVFFNIWTSTGLFSWDARDRVKSPHSYIDQKMKK